MFNRATANNHHKPSTRLGDLLIARRLITQQQLEKALHLQSRRREQTNDLDSHCLGDLLIELGYIQRHHLKTALSWQDRLRKTALALALLPTFTGLLTGCGGSGSGGGDSSPETSVAIETNTPATTPASQKGSVAVSWTKPVVREDGTPIIDSEIDYFLLEIRKDGEDDFQQLQIDDISIDSYSIIDLEPGNYEVRIATVDVNGLTSDYSSSHVEIL